MDVKDIDFDELDRAVNSVISKNNFSNDNSSATRFKYFPAKNRR